MSPHLAGAPSGFTLTGPVVLGQSTENGVPVVPSPDPLTRLNFFDGRLLGAADLTVEQNADRTLSMLLAQAGGVGVAWGLDVDRAGETLSVSAGLAFDPTGRPLLLPAAVPISVSDLLGSPVAPVRLGMAGDSVFGPCVLGQPVEVTVDPISSADVYLLTIGWIEGYCGTMDVYGSACDVACVGSTDRPYRVDGVLFRLRSLTLESPLPTSASVLLTAGHLRSRLAAAYFADERARAGVALSAASLASAAWCHGDSAPSGSEVPLAMLVRFGGTTVWLDEWVARRERLEPPARVGFDGRMAMRSRSAWDAQLGQFQCQLADRLGAGGLPSGTRRLVDAGIVELPSCGYLPIDQSLDVVAQVTAMMGDGIDLRFVPEPVDAIAHLLEEVQHRDRVSLLVGLDDPTAKPPVDILVPGGVSGLPQATGMGFRLTVSLGGVRDAAPLVFEGSARLAPRGMGFTLTGAGTAGASSQSGAKQFVASIGQARGGGGVTLERTAGSATPVSLQGLRRVAAAAGVFAAQKRAGTTGLAAPKSSYRRDDAKPIAARVSLTVDQDLWLLGPGDTAFVQVTADAYTPAGATDSSSLELIGQLTLDSGSPTGTATTRAMRLDGQLSVRGGGGAADLSTVSWPATVSRNASGAGTVFLVSTPDGLVRSLQLGGTPLTIQGDMGSADTFLMVEDPLALNPDSMARQTADLSLQLLRAARPYDGQFYERTRLQAFGRTVDAGAITADRDWVAFRRRPSLPPVVQAPPRTAQIWVSSSESPSAASSVQKILLAGSGDKVPWTRVTTVSFDATTGALTTNHDDLQAAYTGTGAAVTLQYVDYGPTSMPSAQARVAAVLTALAPAATFTNGRAIEGVPDVPADLLDAATDGSIFLIASNVRSTRSTLMQAIAFNTAQDNQQVVDAAKLLTTPSATREMAVNLLPNLATDLGTIDVNGQAADQAQQAAVMKAAAAALVGASAHPELRVLLVDKAWAAANAALFKLADQVAQALATVFGPAEPVVVSSLFIDMGTAPTPTLLVLGFQPQQLV